MGMGIERWELEWCGAVQDEVEAETPHAAAEVFLGWLLEGMAYELAWTGTGPDGRSVAEYRVTLPPDEGEADGHTGRLLVRRVR